MYYLALGNSLATGGDDTTRLIRTRGLGHFANGYAHQLYMMARSQIPELEHVHLACGGETAYGMIHGGSHGFEGPPPYGTCPTLRTERGPQLADAVRFVKAHPEDVAFVTIDIGANDLIACAQPLGEPLDLNRIHAFYSSPQAGECVDLVLKNVHQIATALRSAAGPDTRIVGMTYWSTPLASWLTGPDGKQVATQLTDSVLVPFNAKLKEIFASADIPTADVAATFSTTDYTRVTDPQLGEVPLNVLRICQWTWMCTRSDGHPNTEGNRVIVETFAAVLGL